MVRFKLKVKLAQMNISQKELAEKTGLRQATISAMVNNSTKSVSFENLDLLCKALNCDISDVLEFVEEKEHSLFTTTSNFKEIAKMILQDHYKNDSKEDMFKMLMFKALIEMDNKAKDNHDNADYWKEIVKYMDKHKD